ncbi:MAG: hypothetical protein ISR65_19575 [Bacteriovoracaceae bacterium]|nr:hypothetical protein [Bacteriovoracaceae bacterium]
MNCSNKSFAGYCWGGDFSGRLGDGGADSNQDSPVAVAGGLSFTSIDGGNDHTYGMTTSGSQSSPSVVDGVF